MTKKEAITEFLMDILPRVKQQYESDGIPHFPARAEAWGVFTDALCKGGQISLHRYETWTAPPCCLTKKERRRGK